MGLQLCQQISVAHAKLVRHRRISQPRTQHAHGIDDLRSVNRLTGQALPIYGSPATLAEIRQRFGYVLAPLKAGLGGVFYKPLLEPREIDGPFTVAGIDVVPFRQDHGFSTVTLGFRIGAFGYSTDAIELDDAAFEVLAGIDTWVVDCIRREPHVTHSHLAKTLGWIDRLRPRRAVLTHMDESLDYDTLCRTLPPGVEPGYDGQILEI